MALAAFRSERITRTEATRTLHADAVAYWLPAGVAIVAAWAIDRYVGGDVAWGAAGFAAAAGYLTLSALQAVLGALLHRDGS